MFAINIIGVYFVAMVSLYQGEANTSLNKTVSNYTYSNKVGTNISALNKTATVEHLSAWLIANLVFLSFGLLANLMVLVLSAFTWRISTHYKLTTCLAISDGLYCVLFLLLQSSKASGKDFVGDVGPVCKILYSLISANVFADAWLIVLLSMERYVSICHPLRGGLKLKHVYCLVFAVVLFALISVIPCFMYLCEPNGGPEFYMAFAIYMFVAAAVLPCLVVAGLYAVSIKTLRSLTRSLLNCSNTAVTRRRQYENKRILFIIASLVFMFFILLVPSAFFYVLTTYGFPLSPFWTDFIYVYTENVLPLHTIFNPVIYSLVDHRVRKIITNFVLGRNTNPQSEYGSLKSMTTVV